MIRLTKSIRVVVNELFSAASVIL